MLYLFSFILGDSLFLEKDQVFSTKDQDSTVNGCPTGFKGAWWYNSCFRANLKGLYLSVSGPHVNSTGISWMVWKGYESLTFTEMKIRPYEI